MIQIMQLLGTGQLREMYGLHADIQYTYPFGHEKQLWCTARQCLQSYYFSRRRRSVLTENCHQQEI